MAQVVELGRGPVNAPEREVVRRLAEELPDRTYTVIPNATLPDSRTGHGYEYDVIVVAPHAVYAVEVKGWDGQVRAVSRADWQLDSGTIVHNPLPLIEHKARVLASLIKNARLRTERPPYVAACLVSGFDSTHFDVFTADQDRCRRPSDVAAYLQDAGALGRRAGHHKTLHKPLVAAISGKLEARRPEARRYGSYRVTQLERRDDELAVYLARHAHFEDGRLYRIRVWYLSPYTYEPDARTTRLALLSRSAEVLHTLGDHPNLAELCDFGEHEGEFFEVTEWSPAGTLASAHQRGALKRLPPERRIALIRDIARGLSHAQDAGVFHRSLGPHAVLLTPDGRAQLTDFDTAFVEGAAHTAYGAVGHPHPACLAPELRNADDYEVFDNSDLYALGRMGTSLLAHGLAEPVLGLLARCTEDDPEARPSDPAAFLAELERIVSPPAAQPAPEPETESEQESEDEPDGPPAFAPGDIIDGVNTVVCELGRGSAAVVYKVVNEPLGRELALKLIHSPSPGYDPRAELRILRDAPSPHLPRIQWFGRVEQPDGRTLPYLLQDVAEGQSLRERLDQGRVPLADALTWVDQLLDALAAIHPDGERLGVVHRDVKPANIRLGPNGAVLVDFSSAAPTDQAGKAPVGTLRYTDPEVSKAGWSPTADLYAAGCVLYELVAGRHPFDGQAPSGPPPDLPPSGDRPAPVTAELASVLQKALHPERSQRYPDAGSLRRALAQVRQSLDSPKAPPVGATQLRTVALDSRDDLWSPARLRALTRHPDLQVPLAQALLDCVTPPSDSSPDELVRSFLASEARAHAFEQPLQTVLGATYDLLADGRAPTRLDHGQDKESAAAAVEGSDATVVALQGLHFTEVPLLRAALARARRQTQVLAWVAPTADPEAPGQLGEALRTCFAAAPSVRTIQLDPGDRSQRSLGELLAERRTQVEAAVAGLTEPGECWVVHSFGTIYLGHGLRHDVGEGLGAEADEQRAAWATVFGCRRSTSDGVMGLRTARSGVLRQVAGRTLPVGRVAWPDPPGTPWLQRGGLSVPERVLFLVRVMEEGSA